MDIERVFADRYVYFDSNVFIYVFEDIQPFSDSASKVLEMAENRKCRIATSYLTLMELLIKPMAENNTEFVSKYIELLSPREYLHMIDIDRTVLMFAAELRATTKVKTPDAIHIAAATIAGCDLFFTNDQRVSQFCGMDKSGLPAFVGLVNEGA